MVANKVLVIKPDHIVGEPFYFSAFVNSSLRPYQVIDGTKSGNPNDVKNAILSGEFGTIFVADISHEQKWFTSQFRDCLYAFVNGGGCILFPSVEGGHLLRYILKPIFGVSWELGEYSREWLVSCDSEAFRQWCPDGPRTLNVKTQKLMNVAHNDRLYIPRDYPNETAFALTSVGNGFIAYFGDVNSEASTNSVIKQVLNKARSRDIVVAMDRNANIERPLKVWTDGCCLGNHQRGERSGGIGFAFDSDSGLGSFYGPVVPDASGANTNNIGELQAAIFALIIAKRNGRLCVLLHTDSEYLKDSVTKWISGWKRNGWRKSDGRPVANLDSMKLLDRLMQEMKIEWKWIPRAENAKADSLAKLGTKVYLNEEIGAPKKALVQQTLDQTRSKGLTEVKLINTRRVAVGGCKKIQVECQWPNDDKVGNKRIYCASSFEARGMVKVNPVVTNVGPTRRVKIPVTNTGWNSVDLSNDDELHLILPPGAIVGVGWVKGDPRPLSNLDFEEVFYAPHEDRIGPNPSSENESSIDLEEDDYEDEQDDEDVQEFVFDPYGLAGGSRGEPFPGMDRLFGYLRM